MIILKHIVWETQKLNDIKILVDQAILDLLIKKHTIYCFDQ